MATQHPIHLSVPKQSSTPRRSITYDAAAVARLVGFSLISLRPRILCETGEGMRSLQAIAAGKKPPTLAVLNYFQLTQKGGHFVCIL